MWERNRRFVDSDEDIALSDIESIVRYEDVDMLRGGTVACKSNLGGGYRAVMHFAMYFTDRNHASDDVGDRDGCTATYPSGTRRQWAN